MARVIRARPSMYIGAPPEGVSWPAQLVEASVVNIAARSPSPTAVRVVAWARRAVTIAFDGEPLAIAPSEGLRAVAHLPHPALYDVFLSLLTRATRSTLRRRL